MQLVIKQHSFLSGHGCYTGTIIQFHGTHSTKSYHVIEQWQPEPANLYYTVLERWEPWPRPVKVVVELGWSVYTNTIPLAWYLCQISQHQPYLMLAANNTFHYTINTTLIIGSMHSSPDRSWFSNQESGTRESASDPAGREWRCWWRLAAQHTQQHRPVYSLNNYNNSILKHIKTNLYQTRVFIQIKEAIIMCFFIMLVV